MFTGLVEAIGTVQNLERLKTTARLRIDSARIADGAKVGDSIAINGCCLTIVEANGSALAFEAVEETLNRTNLGQLASGSTVNLERAMTMSDRIGGHYVTGHVDAVGCVDDIEDFQDWKKFWFAVPRTLTRQMASKGSVAVDGVSLTLVDVQDDRFSVALIPHTLEVTTLGRRQCGDAVNIETDLLAKYVQRQLEFQHK